MKKVIVKRIVKIIIFAAVFCGLFLGVSKILQEKWYFRLHINSPETENWKAFYAEPKNSIDVLFLGSSHVYNDINPVIFYEETMLSGFDMASSNQDMFLSYVYLKEALNYQTPKYVIFDAAMFNRGVFAQDKYYEMSFDSMKMSKTKYEALKEWESYNPQKKPLERIFTIIDYHSRWEELEKADFNANGLTSCINGYIPSNAVTPVTMKEYDRDDALWDIPATTRIFFEKINNMCFERDINLILILAPDSSTRFGKTEAVKMLAGEYDITCIDYNELEMFDRTGIDVNTDFKDAGHLNAFGAGKFTKVLASDLKMYGGMNGYEKYEHAGWDGKKEIWNQAYKQICIPTINDFSQYLDMLVDTDYTVIAALCDEGTAGLNEELVAKMKMLGFEEDFLNGYGNSFLGVRSKNMNYCEFTDRVIIKEGKFTNGKYWKTTSASLYAASLEETEPTAVIEIGGVDYAIGRRGISFVVYDETTDSVIDSVCFDTYSENCDASRY